MAIPPFGSAKLKIQEADGSPAGYPIALKFPNGSLTDNGDSTYTFASGAGQSTVTRIVAASGGDHTTLGAAITAASNGDTIWIRNGTYTESTITTSLTGLTIRGESREGVIVDLSTTTCTFSGVDVKLDNLRINISTGQLTMTGANWNMHGVDIITSGNNRHILNSGTNGKMVDCYYYDGTSAFTTSSKIRLSGKGTLVSGCYFSLLNATGSLTRPSVEANANFITFSGCTFRSRGGGTNGPLAGTQTTTANHCTFVGCTFEADSATLDCGLSIYGGNNTVTGCTIRDAYTGIYIGDAYMAITGNNIFQSQAGISIDIGANNTTVIGNLVRSSAGTGTGIKVDGAFDDCVIMGNFVYNHATNINVSNASADRTVVVGNASSTGGTANYNDAGNQTIIKGNNGAGYTHTPVALTDGATITPNCDNGELNTVTLGGNRTMAAPSGTARNGQVLIFALRQDATGSRTVTWNAIFRFTGGTAPTLTTTAAKTDYINFVYNSTDSKWDCVGTALNL